MVSPPSAASSGTGFSTEPARRTPFAVILAGGLGTRLWPLARESRPKQFLPLVDGKSLFRLAYERIAPLVPDERIVIVTRCVHEQWVRRQVPEVGAGAIIIEGTGRDTAASVALAAHWIQARHGDGTMIVLPADHWLSPASGLRAALRRALRAAGRTGGLIILGVQPEGPETAYGYVRGAGGEIAPGVRRAESFVEKPDGRTARRLIKARGTLWNSGIFIWKASVILSELERHRPRYSSMVRQAVARMGARQWRIPARAMRKLDVVSIDRAVLQKSRRLFVVKGSFRWTDLGSWDRLIGVLRKGRGDASFAGKVIMIDAPGCAAACDRGLVAIVGVDDLIVVRSGDVILVGGRKTLSRVGAVPALLRGDLRRYR